MRGEERLELRRERVVEKAPKRKKEKRRFSEALEYAEKAISVDERDWDAYFLAGRNAMNTGDDAKAKKYLRKAEESDRFANIHRKNFTKVFAKLEGFPERRDERCAQLRN